MTAKSKYLGDSGFSIMMPEVPEKVESGFILRKPSILFVLSQCG